MPEAEPLTTQLFGIIGNNFLFGEKRKICIVALALRPPILKPVVWVPVQTDKDKRIR